MTEPSEQTHHLETLGRPSGGDAAAAAEHLPASGRGAAPLNGDRGRQRAPKNCADINTGKFWQMKGGRREVSAGNNDASSELREAPDGGGGGYRKNGEEDRTLAEPLNPEQDSDTGLDARLGRKRHRRRTSRKKRTWKPYDKLSWEEKKALEERETARASRMREEMFAKGLPVAPYNTTQFLMDEHDREEPDLNTETGIRRSLLLGVGGRAEDSGSEDELLFNDNNHEEEDDDDGSGGGGSDGIGRPGNAGGTEFLQRDFSETYEMYHVESLQNMTKQELVREYLELEKCMSRLEEENNRLRRAVEPPRAAAEGPGPGRLRELELELERLRAENTELLLRSRDRGLGATD